MRALNPTDIGDQNKISMLRIIKDNNGISRQEISKRLHLSAPAVSKNISALLKTGIISEGGSDETTLGRKPIQLCYNANIMCVLGIELMPGCIRAMIANLNGTIMGWEERFISLSDGAEGVLQQLDHVIESLMDKKPDSSVIASASVAVPALTGQEDLNDLFAAYIPEWKHVDLKQYIEDKFHFQTTVMNDVELALLGERTEGIGKDSKDILYIKYGEGFAARAIVDGRLLKGHNMAAGEIGYYIEDIKNISEGFVCPGRLEVDICRHIMGQYNKGKVLNFQILQEYAQNGDAKAISIIEEITDKIAIVISNTVLVLNSEIVILGGVASELSPQNLQKIKTVLERTCPFVPQVVISKLGVKAPVIGGIKVALECAEKQMVMFWRDGNV